MTTKLVFYLVIYIAYYLKTISSQFNCSAIDSYVKITSPASIERTIVSAKSAFPPYNYYIPSTEVVVVSGFDICHNLIEDGDCSPLYKTFIAQSHNAVAVLLVNSDADGDYPTVIFDDGYILPGNGILTIPTRQIIKIDAEAIQSEINSGINILAH